MVRNSGNTQHATVVAVGGSGVMLCGPSGSGKSDLALRLIDAGAKLVADDRTVLTLENGHLIASPPEPLKGRLEVRGLGIVDVPFQTSIELGLVVDLKPLNEIERMPEPSRVEVEGITVPRIELCAFEAAAQAKLRLALSQLVAS